MTVVNTLFTACAHLREQEPLSRHTSFGIGGPADYFADVTRLDELMALRRVAAEQKLPIFFIGAGSNLLVSDRGIRGLVIHLQGDFRSLVFEETTVRVGAGAWMPVLAKQAADHGLSGVEAMIGVPGTVGGGLIMNAGTRDGWMGDVTTGVDVLTETGEVKTLSSESFGFAYRTSRLGSYWITGAQLTLKKSDIKTVQEKLSSIIQYRTRTQPLATSNCGSVFKNPEGKFAAQLIEEAGLKGHAVGGARVSERHANFIINEKDATASDVRALILHIQSRVQEKSGVLMEPEVKMVGDW
jgi:UDP-N-acetylmuramate dehydrogenase